MSSAGRVLELVGVRAVIQDVRQYLTDAKRIETANQNIANANNKLTLNTLSLAKAQTLQTTQATALAAADARLATANRDLAAAQALVKSGLVIPGVSQAQLQTRLAQATTEVKDATRARANAEKDLKAAIRDIVPLENERIRLSEAQARAELHLTQLRQRRVAAFAQAGAIVAGAAAVGVSTAAIKSASTYQDILIKIDNLTNATTEETKRLGDQILELSTQIPVGPAELASAAYFALSSGIGDVATALDIVTVAAKGQTTGLGDVTQVTKFLTGAIVAYGKENLSAADATDLLSAAAIEGRAEASDYAQELGRVTGIAATMGIGLDELLAVTAQLSNTLGSTGEATTGLLGILTHLNRVAPQSERAFQGIDLSIKEVKDRIDQVGLIPFLTELAKLTAGNEQALGDIFQDRRAINAFFQAFNDGGTRVNEILVKIRQQAGITQENFERANQSFSNQAKILRNQLNVALIQIGTAALPAITEAVQKLIVLFKENEEAISLLIRNGLLIAINVFGTLITTLGTATKALKFLFDTLSSSLGGKVTLGALAAGVAAIGVAFTWALPGGPVILGLIAIATLIDQINKGVNIPVLGRVGGVQNPETGQRNFGGRETVQGNVVQQLRGEDVANKILNAITPAFLQSEEWKQAEAAVKRLREAGITTVEQFNRLTAAQKASFGVTDALKLAEEKNTEEKKKAEIALKQREQAENLDNQAIRKSKEELEKLVQTFQRSAEAAREVENIAESLQKFGIISRELAQTLGLSATQAGNIQGIDAVKAATERADEAAFNFAATLATVAQAFEDNASVAEDIVRELARSALEAAQNVASLIFSRPTREVANLNVQLAQLELAAARAAAANRGLIDSLNSQLRSLDDRIDQLNKQQKQQQNQQRESDKRRREQEQENQKRERAAEQAAEKARQESEKARQRAERSILDALQLANLIARQAYERFQDQLEILIEGQQKAASELQETFLKNNEEIQKRINQAIGQGDTATALALVDQQRQQTKQYREQSSAIEKNIDDLELQGKVAARAERERQRQAELQEALAQSAQNASEAIDNSSKAFETNKESTDENTESTESNTDAIDDQIESIEEQKKKILEQIETAKEGNKASRDQIEIIKEQIKIYELESKALQAMVTASDKTLLSQAEQAEAAKQIAKDIALASGIIRDSAKTVFDLLPGVDSKALKEQFDLLQKALEITTNDAIRTNFVERGLDYAALHAQLLAGNLNKLGGRMNAAGNQANNAANLMYKAGKTLEESANNFKSSFSRFFTDFQNKVNSNLSKTPPKPNALGGLYSSPTNIIVSESNQKELVIPLNRPARARELISLIPPSLAAAIRPSRDAQAIFAPNIRVTGETLDTMEATAMRAVQQAFRDARTASVRRGGAISSGLGPAV